MQRYTKPDIYGDMRGRAERAFGRYSIKDNLSRIEIEARSRAKFAGMARCERRMENRPVDAA